MRSSKMARIFAITAFLGGWLLSFTGGTADAAQIVYPSKDGTLVDGGIYGPFDGVADAADWSFNESGYEGTITLATEGACVENRLTWEYDLSGVTLDPPVTAILTFTVRGPSIYPFPDVDVHVYAYPADLVERRTDFNIEPVDFQGNVTVLPYQPPTENALDVGAVVSEALLSGEDKVGFRFQVDPGTVNPSNQAFIDALDSDPPSKPFLTISEGAMPGDFDGDHDVDLQDFLSFQTCFTGPGDPLAPACEPADFDGDGDVDLQDFLAFQTFFTGPGG